MSERQPPLTMVRKRSGKLEPFCADKVLDTLRRFTYDLDTDYLDLDNILRYVVLGKVDNMSTDELQSLMALSAANLTSTHPDYSILAGRLEVCNLHRRTVKSFSEFVLGIHRESSETFNKDFVLAVRANANALDSAIRHGRDYDFNYFSIRVLERTYLLSRKGKIVERPQFMWMRTAVQLHGADLPAVLETYDHLSRGLYTHATPTLKNSGLLFPQLASCFIQSVDARTTPSIFSTLYKTASIFMNDGGVGLDFHTVPAKRSDRHPPQPGLIALMRLIDSTAKYTTSARYARPAAAAVFIAPWHADVFEFIDSRANVGVAELRTRDIFNGLVIPDLFMDRVRDDQQWSLFDPLDVPNLWNCYGHEFVRVYSQYETDRVARRVLPARELWERIIHQQIETGTPYMLYLDAINRKSNQRNRGVIYCANLCTEIVQFASPTETAVCTLASLILPAFIRDNDSFDFAALHRATKLAVRNTDRIVDLNHYPTDEARWSAEQTRGVGIGQQGLADVFMILRMPFDSPEAQLLSVAISETMYHAAIDASCDLARASGTYPTWNGSPASELQLQFDLWGKRPSGRYDFDALKAWIGRHGLRNSVLTAQMPTSSTSQISGVNDGVEPYLSNVYVRRGLTGECQIINKWLVRDLISHELWTDDMRQRLLRNRGSVQDIAGIPTEVKRVYKTAWELSQKTIIDLAADRGPFICQSQSTTVYVDDPTYKKLTSMHFYGWSSGLKTGMYYLRTQPAMYPIQFALPPVPDHDIPARPTDTPLQPESDGVLSTTEATHGSRPTTPELDPGVRADRPSSPATEPQVLDLVDLLGPGPLTPSHLPAASCSGCGA